MKVQSGPEYILALYTLSIIHSESQTAHSTDNTTLHHIRV
jgi:hypothetical protein